MGKREYRIRRKIFLFFLATLSFGVASYLGYFLAYISISRYIRVKEEKNGEHPSPTPQASSPKVWTEKDYMIYIWLPRRIKERQEKVAEEADNSSVFPQKGQFANVPPALHPGADVSRPLVMGSEIDSQSHQDVMAKRLPQALIIGVKKSGTRALLEFLRLHPDIRATGPETHFFDRFYHQGLDWYRQQMPTSLPGQITMEKTPSYFITREVPQRIHSMSSTVKLIVVVRDPVTRAISDYTQTVIKRKGTHSFKELAFRNASTGLVDTSWSAIRIGVYARYLEWWLGYFGLDQMHFVSGETLVRNPAKEMARLQDFLGLKKVVNEKHFYYNETKGFPCLRKSEDNANVHCLGKNKGRSHPNIPVDTIQRLRDFFRPFNIKFYKMVGVDFGWP